MVKKNQVDSVKIMYLLWFLEKFWGVGAGLVYLKVQNFRPEIWRIFWRGFFFWGGGGGGLFITNTPPSLERIYGSKPPQYLAENHEKHLWSP